MEATNTIYEIMTLLASATKGLKKSIDMDGIDIFIAQSMTDIVRKVRDLAPEEMDILLSQLRCELNEENYVRVCSELSGTMSEYLDLYNDHKEEIDYDYSPFHLCEMAKEIEHKDHDILNKLESHAPLALSKIVTRMMSPLEQEQDSLINLEDKSHPMSDNPKKKVKKKPGRPPKTKYEDITDLFVSKEGYAKLCMCVNKYGPLNCHKARSLHEAVIGSQLLKPGFKNAGDFANLMKAEFPNLLSIDAGSSIYDGEFDPNLVNNIKDDLERR